MRRIILLCGLALHAACDSCPDGNAEGSLFCHAANCAADEAVCAGACSNLQSDRDNCGACGTQCGDGQVCALGQCVDGCDNGLASCAADEVCENGVCGCAAGDIVCGGVCTNPQTSQNFCGATGACTGSSVGDQCTSEEACLNGVCTSKLIYRGSLPASTGRWQYMATLGLNGANMDCNAHWPGSQVCSYQKLLAASTKAVPETINAKDYNNVAVTTWWIDDPTATGGLRCQSNQDGIPWSYGTADQGHVGKSVTLTAGTGAISALQTDALPSCNQMRFVPCCSIVTAP